MLFKQLSILYLNQINIFDYMQLFRFVYLITNVLTNAGIEKKRYYLLEQYMRQIIYVYLHFN